MGDFVSYKFKDGIAVVTIDNPPMNVLSKQVQKELIAEADIKEFPHMIHNPKMHEDVMAMHEVLSSLDSMSKPTIVVLDGLSLGGGCELALAFDIRIMEEHVQIGLPEVNLGIFPGAGGRSEEH